MSWLLTHLKRFSPEWYQLAGQVHFTVFPVRFPVNWEWFKMIEGDRYGTVCDNKQCKFYYFAWFTKTPSIKNTVSQATLEMKIGTNCPHQQINIKYIVKLHIKQLKRNINLCSIRSCVQFPFFNVLPLSVRA